MPRCDRQHAHAAKQRAISERTLAEGGGLLIALVVLQSLQLLVQLSTYGLFTRLAGRRR